MNFLSLLFKKKNICIVNIYTMTKRFKNFLREQIFSIFLFTRPFEMYYNNLFEMKRVCRIVCDRM